MDNEASKRVCGAGHTEGSGSDCPPGARRWAGGRSRSKKLTAALAPAVG